MATRASLVAGRGQGLLRPVGELPEAVAGVDASVNAVAVDVLHEHLLVVAHVHPPHVVVAPALEDDRLDHPAAVEQEPRRAVAAAVVRDRRAAGPGVVRVEEVLPVVAERVEAALEPAERQLTRVPGGRAPHLLKERAIDPKVVVLDVVARHLHGILELLVADHVAVLPDPAQDALADPSFQARKLPQPAVLLGLRHRRDVEGERHVVGRRLAEAVAERGVEAAVERLQVAGIDDHCGCRSLRRRPRTCPPRRRRRRRRRCGRPSTRRRRRR